MLNRRKIKYLCKIVSKGLLEQSKIIVYSKKILRTRPQLK